MNGGRTRTNFDLRFHNALAALGCAACWKDGRFNSWGSIHHIEGRTKPLAHKLVLFLCAGHHQDGTGAPGLIAIHPYKARFEAKYGGQYELLANCVQRLPQKDLALEWLGFVADMKEFSCCDKYWTFRPFLFEKERMEARPCEAPL